MGITQVGIRGKHTIEVKDVAEWKSSHWVQLAASAARFSRKRLEANLDGMYRVINYGRVIYSGENLSDAVAAYNHAD